MKPQIFRLIKTVSTVLITAALGLVCANLYLHLNHKTLPSQLDSVYSIASIALIVHVIGGAIAAFKANSREKNAIAYGIYTFFVGYIGLKELSNN